MLNSAFGFFILSSFMTSPEKFMSACKENKDSIKGINNDYDMRINYLYKFNITENKTIVLEYNGIVFIVETEPIKGKEFSFEVLPAYNTSNDSICYMTIDYSIKDSDPEKFLGGIYTLINNIFISYVNPYIIKNGSIKSKMDELFVIYTMLSFIESSYNNSTIKDKNEKTLINLNTPYYSSIYKSLYSKIANPYNYMNITTAPFSYDTISYYKGDIFESYKYIKSEETKKPRCIPYLIDADSDYIYEKISSVVKTDYIDYGEILDESSDEEMNIYVSKILNDLDYATENGNYICMIKIYDNCRRVVDILSRYIPFTIIEGDHEYQACVRTDDGSISEYNLDTNIVGFIEDACPAAFNRLKINAVKTSNDMEVLKKVMNNEEVELKIELPSEPLINE